MSGYTFCMREVIWLLAVAAAGGFGYWLWSWRRRRAELKRASEERFASFMAQAMVAAKSKAPDKAPVDTAALARQRLLLEAAAKAGEAGEPVLSIQLYARLLARYPDTGFAAQARAAVEAQKKKLAKA
jgi:hypothetical protein